MAFSSLGLAAMSSLSRVLAAMRRLTNARSLYSTVLRMFHDSYASMEQPAAKGSLKSKFTELTLRFRSDLVAAIE